MHLSITGPPTLLRRLFMAAAQAIDSDGSYSFSGIEAEDGLELIIDIEGDPTEDILSWEQM